MKRFRYSLDAVLDYKTQVLDNLKTEHAVIQESVNKSKETIRQLKQGLTDFESDFNQTKTIGASIESFRLYDMCIGRMEAIIDEEKERLLVLRQKEESKKKEVISAKVDTSKFEKLKDRKLKEYYREVAKSEEAFVEEFVIRSVTSERRQGRGAM